MKLSKLQRAEKVKFVDKVAMPWYFKKWYEKAILFLSFCSLVYLIFKWIFTGGIL